MLSKLRRAAEIIMLALVLLIGLQIAVAQEIEEKPDDESEDTKAAFIPSAISLTTCNNHTIQLYNVCEVVINQTAYANNQDKDAYKGPDVKAVFHNNSNPSVQDKLVHAFYDKDASGKIVFKIRFNASERPRGTGPTNADSWTYTPSCTMQAGGVCPGGIQLVQGNFLVEASATPDAGFLRRDVASDKFIYSNGVRPYIWGQTYYNIVTNVRGNGQWANAIVQSSKYVNKIRMLLYPFNGSTLNGITYPDSHPFTDGPHDTVNLVHWTAFDQAVNQMYATRDLSGNRMLAEVILFTDSRRDSFGLSSVEDDRYLKYAAARYGAFPNVMWCLANEWEFAIIPGMTMVDLTKKPLVKAYLNVRAMTVAGADPWMTGGLNGQPRAITIHGINKPVQFEFFDQPWPSHAAVQFSIGHDSCTGGCSSSDEWANYSIVKNVALAHGWPVVNDEYGYLSTHKDGPPEQCLITADEQRRGMWAIAAGGGFGTFGDNTGSCAHPAIPAPINRSDWVFQNSYVEIQKLTDFFGNVLSSKLPAPFNSEFNWWKMKSRNDRVVVATTVGMRAYVLEQAGTSAAAHGRVNEVIYVVPKGANSGTNFIISNIPVGHYKVRFYDPRNGELLPASDKYIATLTQTSFSTPTKPGVPGYGKNDWVMWLYPDPTQALAAADAASSDEIVWVDETLPTGANPVGGNESWNWIESDPLPITETYAHQSALMDGTHQHYFTGATETLTVNAGDKLFAYVYLDPLNPPTEIMLQWDDGSGAWAHRAYWGANQIPWGEPGPAHYYAGALPPTDQWVRLEVPASAVGLEGVTLNSMAFSLYDGLAAWDCAGKTGSAMPATALAIGKPTTQSSVYTASPVGGPAWLATPATASVAWVQPAENGGLRLGISFTPRLQPGGPGLVRNQLTVSTVLRRLSSAENR